jgi:hypothetical protein
VTPSWARTPPGWARRGRRARRKRRKRRNTPLLARVEGGGREAPYVDPTVAIMVLRMWGVPGCRGRLPVRNSRNTGAGEKVAKGGRDQMAVLPRPLRPTHAL